MISIPVDELYMMLLCSLRYGLGRCSYITFEIGEYLEKYFDALDASQQGFLIRELEQELKRHEDEGKACGQKMDHKMWVELAATLRGKKK